MSRPPLLIATPWDQETGGVASVVGNLAIGLRERGHEVLFLNIAEVPGLERISTSWGFDGYRLNMRPPSAPGRPVRGAMGFVRSFAETFFHLIRIVRRHRIQLINVHYPVDAFLYFGLLRRIIDIPLVTSVHGSDVMTNGQPRARYNWGLQLLLNASDLIIAPSNALAENVGRAFPHKRASTVCVHNGIDVDELLLNGNDEPAIGAPYVLSIAVLEVWKGVDLVVDAYARIAARFPDLRLVLVGDGSERASLEAAIDKYGLSHRVDFLGDQPRARVARLLKDCEVLAFGTRAEAFGLVVAEAMACGRPVVATAVGGVPELIDQGKDGLLVPQDDTESFARALELVLSDRDRAAKMGAAGAAKARERFSRERNAQAYFRHFDALLNS